MGNIPINTPDNPPVHITWQGGQKIVETGGGVNGGRVDVYENGAGRPDGPGHDHYWATFNRGGQMTSSGGDVRS